MKLDGTIEIRAEPQAVWDLLIDPVGLAACVPGVNDVRQVDERTFEGSITAAVGPMEGHFSFVSVLTQASFPDDLVVEVTGTDSVTRSRLEMHIEAGIRQPADGVSELGYRATVKVKGRLAILGEMVLRATAGLMITQVTRCLRSQLETASAVAPPSAGG